MHIYNQVYSVCMHIHIQLNNAKQTNWYIAFSLCIEYEVEKICVVKL